MHNSWQNYAKIEFHQDFLKGKNLERLLILICSQSFSLDPTHVVGD